MIVEISFEEIYPIWRDYLWTNRASKIEPLSVIQADQTYDMTIVNYTPTFFGYMQDGEIIGVNSGFRTTKTYFRSRGLYVFPPYRNNHVGTALLYAVEGQARKENCNLIWTLPRKSVLPVYEQAGYVRITEFFSEGVEFGPNCVGMKYLL